MTSQKRKETEAKIFKKRPKASVLQPHSGSFVRNRQSHPGALLPWGVPLHSPHVDGGGFQKHQRNDGKQLGGVRAAQAFSPQTARLLHEDGRREPPALSIKLDPR